ncbi:MAG: hypothetical protein JRN62_02985 [Nitrososphaerota archaeon]|nr:hypothetical protein [Nitrososphaerota archaeon]MDG6948959.1 hypothetical protein [Nitrososphaerota archaeon]
MRNGNTIGELETGQEEPELTELKQRLESARARLASVDETNARLVAALNGDKVMDGLAEKRRNAEAALKAAEKAAADVWAKARSNIIDGSSNTACFARAGVPGSEDITNIRDNVLAAIKSNTDFDVMTDGDIELIASSLIQRFAYANPDYRKNAEAYAAASEANSRAAVAYLTRFAQYNPVSIGDLKVEVDRLEKLLADPKRAVAVERRRKEMERMPKTVSTIFESLSGGRS